MLKYMNLKNIVDCHGHIVVSLRTIVVMTQVVARLVLTVAISFLGTAGVMPKKAWIVVPLGAIIPIAYGVVMEILYVTVVGTINIIITNARQLILVLIQVVPI